MRSPTETRRKYCTTSSTSLFFFISLLGLFSFAVSHRSRFSHGRSCWLLIIARRQVRQHGCKNMEQLSSNSVSIVQSQFDTCHTENGATPLGALSTLDRRHLHNRVVQIRHRRLDFRHFGTIGSTVVLAMMMHLRALAIGMIPVQLSHLGASTIFHTTKMGELR